MYLQVFTVVLGCLALLDQANAAEPRLNWQEPAVEGTLLKVYKIWITHPAPDQLTPGEEARDRARGLARLARVPINAEDPSVTLVEYGEFLNTFSNHFMPLNFGENVTTDIAGLTTDDLDDVESRIKAWNFVGCAADNATRRYCLDAMLMLSQLAKAPGAGLGDPRTDVSKLFKDKCKEHLEASPDDNEANEWAVGALACMLASDVATERLPLSLLLRWDDFWGDLESNKAGLVDPAFKEYLLPIIMVLRPEACMPTYMKGFKAKSINSKDLFYCRSKHEEDGNEVAYTAKFVSFAKTALQYDGIDTDWRVGDLEQDLERAVGVGKTFVNENVVGRPCREFGPGGGHELIPYLTHYKFFFIASECE